MQNNYASLSQTNAHHWPILFQRERQGWQSYSSTPCLSLKMLEAFCFLPVTLGSAYSSTLRNISSLTNAHLPGPLAKPFPTLALQGVVACRPALSIRVGGDPQVVGGKLPAGG